MISKLKTSINELLNLATKKEVYAFLEDILLNNNKLYEKFEIKIKGQCNILDKTNIDYLKNNMLNTFKKFDLVNVDRFFNYNYEGESYGYTEAWEYLQNGAEIELITIFSKISTKISDYLDIENIINAYKNIFALFEVINDDILNELNDPECIFDDNDISYFLIPEFETYIDKFSNKFFEVTKEESAIIIIIDNIFQRIELNKKLYLGNFKLFNKLFFNLIINKDIANYMKEKFIAFEISIYDIDDVLLKIYELLENKTEWLKLSEKTCYENYEVAINLLDYLKNNKKDRFIYFSKELVFIFDSKILSYLMKNFNETYDYDFYKKILFEYGIKYLKLNAFKKLLKIYTPEDINDFVEDVKNKTNNEFYIKILNENKDYEKMLDLVKKITFFYDLNYYLPFIINIYPEESFYLSKKIIDDFLENNIGRKYYKQVAEILRLLSKNKNIVNNVANYIEFLIAKYKRRIEMKEEFMQIM